MSLFKHTQSPPDSTQLPAKLRHMGRAVTETVLHPHMPQSLKHLSREVSESVRISKRTRCRACFAELSPEDQVLGCCSDSVACGCRASAARCW
jgi:hypothetical protein